jgi:ABC-type polysaccharide/polyol phosphate export permease
VRRSGALLTLARRRAALTAHNPRQIAVPLLTPILFAPVIAILPWFFGGALFPIAALPTGLTAFAKVPPLTHALALMRYGLVDPRGTGLHDIWGMSSTTTEAWLSLGVVVAFAAALTALAIRVFGRSAVR